MESTSDIRGRSKNKFRAGSFSPLWWEHSNAAQTCSVWCSPWPRGSKSRGPPELLLLTNLSTSVWSVNTDGGAQRWRKVSVEAGSAAARVHWKISEFKNLVSVCQAGKAPNTTVPMSLCCSLWTRGFNFKLKRYLYDFFGTQNISSPASFS